MGEIADALKRARERGPREAPVREREAPAPPRRESAPLPAPRPTEPAPAGDVRVSRGKGADPMWRARAVIADESKPWAAGFRQFALRVSRAMQARDARTLMVVSGLQSEGKTLTACNLALALGTLVTDRNVALVDFDLRCPEVSHAFGMVPQVGMETVLAGEAPLSAARFSTDQGLDVYPVRAPVRGAHELLSRPSAGAVVRALGQAYELVVIDTPPTLVVPDVEIVGQHVDAMVAVVRAKATRTAVCHALVEQLPSEKLLGFFMNDISLPRPLQYSYSAYSDAAAGQESL